MLCNKSSNTAITDQSHSGPKQLIEKYSSTKTYLKWVQNCVISFVSQFVCWVLNPNPQMKEFKNCKLTEVYADCYFFGLLLKQLHDQGQPINENLKLHFTLNMWWDPLSLFLIPCLGRAVSGKYYRIHICFKGGWCLQKCQQWLRNSNSCRKQWSK